MLSFFKKEQFLKTRGRVAAVKYKSQASSSSWRDVVYYCNKFLHSSDNPGVITDRETQTQQWLTLALRLFFFRCDTEIGYPLSYLHAMFLPGRPLGPFAIVMYYMASSIEGGQSILLFFKEHEEREKKIHLRYYVSILFFHWKFPFYNKNLPELKIKLKSSFLLHVFFCNNFAILFS